MISSMFDHLLQALLKEIVDTKLKAAAAPVSPDSSTSCLSL